MRRNGKLITNIVFTKNRPLQLEGYLRSLYTHFPEEIFKTFILYKKELFSKEYKQLFSEFPGCVVIEESDFSKDFFNIVKHIDTEYMMFGVDDVVYFDGVDFEIIDRTFKEHSVNIFGFSLRFDKEILGAGGDIITENNVNGQAVCSIDWTDGKTPNSRYPFELCATIYKTELVKKILKGSRVDNPITEFLFAPSSAIAFFFGLLGLKRKLLKSLGYFYSPNTLESWNCRWCRKNSGKLPRRLSFQKHCASAIQVNLVNTSTANESEGTAEQTVETLAEKYRQGYRIDIESLESNRPMHTHSGTEFFRLSKKDN